ncbi:Rieske (2Fe-2S) protein [Promethearchaeum syntrophicum]|uniref:Rieske (2Fe-2S) protein n=1 Tax=Promethearchaeum syntrophicum TaxID=2594042 RepID=A0A5B9D5S0_9ARCH|nr:Rieske 2Fe-2S domain-containing protein [Candidatus Prometheoarchaeum syntrophicum]QEE14469.1 3-phenylpropionate dioxygenase ferredoxin subunit [Candidatus Prometheoarchaeum syntrophicum]
MEKKIELKIDEIKENQGIKINLENIEILLTKIDGKIYATTDRCGHMSVSLSAGEVHDGIVTCPMHKAQFNIKTGEKIRGPKIPKLLSPTKMGKLMNNVKTHNLRVYPVHVRNEEIFIDM